MNLALISELTDPCPVGWRLPIGPSRRATAVPIPASPSQPYSQSQVSLKVPGSSWASEVGQTSPHPGMSRDQLPGPSPVPPYPRLAVLLPTGNKKTEKGSRSRV